VSKDEPQRLPEANFNVPMPETKTPVSAAARRIGEYIADSSDVAYKDGKLTATLLVAGHVYPNGDCFTEDALEEMAKYSQGQAAEMPNLKDAHVLTVEDGDVLVFEDALSAAEVKQFQEFLGGKNVLIVTDKKGVKLLPQASLKQIEEFIAKRDAK